MNINQASPYPKLNCINSLTIIYYSSTIELQYYNFF